MKGGLAEMVRKVGILLPSPSISSPTVLSRLLPQVRWQAMTTPEPMRTVRTPGSVPSEQALVGTLIQKWNKSPHKV